MSSSCCYTSAPITLNLTTRISSSSSRTESLNCFNFSKIWNGIRATKSQGRMRVLQVIAQGSSGVDTTKKDTWRGIPTKLNTCPHTREIREYFYKEVCQSTKNAVNDGLHKLRVQITIPELNPEMDVYRIGTLLELIRELAFTFANDGKRVRVCVQGAMGAGIFSGMPLQLAGTRQLLERMDWGDYDAKGTFVNFGAIGEKEVQEEDELFILMAPQNAVGNCIIDDLKAMVEAAGNRPVIIVNPKLKDLPASGGVMQIIGRDKRIEFAESFFTCYNFRLLYTSGTLYPIVGALRMAYPEPYEVFKRFDLAPGTEKYSLIATFDHEPNRSDMGDAFSGRVKMIDGPSLTCKHISVKLSGISASCSWGVTGRLNLHQQAYEGIDEQSGQLLGTALKVEVKKNITRYWSHEGFLFKPPELTNNKVITNKSFVDPFPLKVICLLIARRLQLPCTMK